MLQVVKTLDVEIGRVSENLRQLMNERNSIHAASPIDHHAALQQDGGVDDDTLKTHDYDKDASRRGHIVLTKAQHDSSDDPQDDSHQIHIALKDAEHRANQAEMALDTEQAHSRKTEAFLESALAQIVHLSPQANRFPLCDKQRRHSSQTSRRG